MTCLCYFTYFLSQYWYSYVDNNRIQLCSGGFLYALTGCIMNVITLNDMKCMKYIDQMFAETFTNFDRINATSQNYIYLVLNQISGDNVCCHTSISIAVIRSKVNLSFFSSDKDRIIE